MIVTRTERFTEWSYQGAHMGEKPSTVGNGLMDGYIYFRDNDDFLQDGDEITREVYFVELSDGTEYELGAGASAAKITIINHGLTSGGDVCIQVIGKPDVGVGVSRILRDVTISYDDGKVPVLDTDQLNTILGELNDSLTAEMVETAETVKTELRAEVENVKLDADTRIDETNRNVEAVRTRVGNIGNDLDSMRTELSRRIGVLNEKASRVCGWAHTGFFTANSKSWVNFLRGGAGDITGNTEFLTREGDYLKLADGVKDYDRLLKVSVTGIVTFATAGEISDLVRIALRKKDGTVIAQVGQFFKDTAGSGGAEYTNVQFNIMCRIHANDANHPLLTNGLALSFGRVGSQQVKLTNPGVTCVLESSM